MITFNHERTHTYICTEGIPWKMKFANYKKKLEVTLFVIHSYFKLKKICHNQFVMKISMLKTLFDSK